MEGNWTTRARWVEIDLGAIAHNVGQVKQLLKPGVQLMAVVKANAYGHGALQAAKIALTHGATMLGVTHPEEGVSLRESGIDAPILVFRSLLPGEEEMVTAYGLTASLGNLEQAKRLSYAALRAGLQVSVHVKIETGMGRTGFTPASIRGSLDELLHLPGLRWKGIYTHFAAAARDPAFTTRQFQVFMELVHDLGRCGVRFPFCHVCNSAALLLYPEMHLNMVRIGTLLYGQLPGGIKNVPFVLRKTWSFWTRVIQLQPVARGATVGYGRTYQVHRDTVLAVLPVGYADGFGLDVVPRPAGLRDLVKVLAKIVGAYCGLPWGASYVRVNGKCASVVGRIGMELSCVDVGKIPNVEIGTPVLLPAKRTLLQEAVPRLYEGQEKVSPEDA